MKKARAKSTPELRVLDCEAVVSEVRTRIPFRYGTACLTASPTLLVRVSVELSDGTTGTGVASDCLPPAWFDKNTKKTYRDNVTDQLKAFHQAREIYLLLGGKQRTAFELWQEAYTRILEEAFASGINALTASFGSSFFERAVIDALCRLRGLTFFETLKDDLLGMEIGKYLPSKPLQAIACRHTVGLGDPLTEGEISDADRLDDGLPQALEADIEFYGLRYFKVKVSGDSERDVERLSRMAALFSQRCRNGYSITLDGNEQYQDPKDLERLIENLRGRPYGQEFFDNVLFIEQPLHRDIALDAKVAGGIASLAELKPVIIDESDDRLDSFERAVELGYHGTSHKNCKGIFRSLQNRVRIIELNQEVEGAPYFQTAEDLANLSVVPLQQDLASICALGIDHAERNGHHFFRGLDHLPAAETESALAHHGDLYEERQDSAFVRVVDGTILCESVVKAKGFGYSCEIAFEERTPLEEWSFDRLGLD